MRIRQKQKTHTHKKDARHGKSSCSLNQVTYTRATMRRIKLIPNALVLFDKKKLCISSYTNKKITTIL